MLPEQARGKQENPVADNFGCPMNILLRPITNLKGLGQFKVQTSTNKATQACFLDLEER